MAKKISTVLITGGAGFIGSNLSNSLINKGFKVYAVDSLSKGKVENLNSKINFFKQDITKAKFINTVKKLKLDVFFHFAAQSSLQASFANPTSNINTNLVATVKIIEALRFQSNLKKFVFASSAAVYGPSDKLPIKENAILNPQTPYGITKLSSEFFIRAFNTMYNFPYVIFRFSNVYGPRQNSTSDGGVVSIFVDNLVNGKTIVINNNGHQTRDFIFVDDVVDACLKAASFKSNGLFNISSAKETSIDSLISNLKKISNKSFKIVYKPQGVLEVKSNSLSNIKAKKLLKWRPRTPIAVGLKKTFLYFSQT